MLSDGLTDDEMHELVARELQDALDHVYADIQPDRERVLQYLRGQMPDLPSDPGASTIVDRTVKDFIGLALPGLMRIFTSGRVVGSFVADEAGLTGSNPNPLERLLAGGDAAAPAPGHGRGAAAPPGGAPELREAPPGLVASVLTDYVDHILRRDHDGEVLIYQWMYDALTQKTGVIHVVVEDQSITHEESRSLPVDQMEAVLIQAAAVGITVSHYRERHGVATARFSWHEPKSHIRLDCVAPEDFVKDRDSIDLERARFVAVRGKTTVGALVHAGFDPDILDRLSGYDDNDARDAGVRSDYALYPPTDSNDPAMRPVSLSTCYILCNRDGTGIKRWRVLVAGGGGSIEILDEQVHNGPLPLAVLRPHPDPHLFFADCPADDLCDVQKAKTFVLRKTMTNLAHATSPQRMVARELIEDLADLETFQPNASIRVRGPDARPAVSTLQTPFVGAAGLEMAAYWDMVAETRTGIGKRSVGLGPDVLANQSATAAAIQQAAAVGRVETIARIFASTGFRHLFKLIAHAVCQDRHQLDRLRAAVPKGKDIPASAFQHALAWEGEIDTGLGTGNRESDRDALLLLLQKMERIMQLYGTDSPLVSVEHYHQALVKLTESMGIRNVDRFWRDPAPILAAMRAVPKPNPGPPPPSPELIEAQAEVTKAEVQKRKVELDAQKLALQRDKANQEAVEAGYKLDQKQQEIDLKAAKAGIVPNANDIAIPTI